MNWTEEQLAVIETEDRSLLVSAAAGSGKTAVLVERIIRMITEKKIDIDRLLIVTFTNAAAAEMRTRIAKAIHEALNENPNDEHLQRQSLLIHHAMITTIHSFCLNVCRNYFHRVGLEPDFRIMDEGEGKLMKEDLIEAVLEDWYERRDPDFMRLADAFVTAKGDTRLKDMILELARCADSHPWPVEWLRACRDSYLNPEPLSEQGWMKMMLHDRKLEVVSQIERARKLEKFCLDLELPRLADTLHRDVAAVEPFLQAESYDEFRALLPVKFDRMTADKGADPDIKERIKKERDGIKKAFQDLENIYFSFSPDELAAQTVRNAGMISAMTKVTEEYLGLASETKRKKNVLDFGDLEHYALEILIDQKDGVHEPTEVAKQYRDRFHEIMIDEYQDSNEVQETILTAISGMAEDRYNLFMVGDVKQSIYKFRLAKPELFMKKYETFESDGLQEMKIELSRNFRSRSSVIDGVNFIFRNIMREELGGIEYTDRQALYLGAEYPETEEPVEMPIELRLLETEGAENGRYPDRTGVEWEAAMVADRIRALIDPKNGRMVWDKEKKEYRRAEYRDIAILLRTTKDWTVPFIEVLGSYGIPAVSGNSTGYFSAREVRVVLNYLRILDNPYQDIPLASVLLSEIGGFLSTELAQIRILAQDTDPDLGFFGKLIHYAEHVEDQIAKKAGQFLHIYEELKSLEKYVSLEELLEALYDRTGYRMIMRSMVGGERRSANLMMLVDKAKQFEKTSYRGLFRFVRYIEQLEKYEVDFGEASTIEGDENVVQILSIHKSKGLEFPIVFVSGLAKNFNEMDSMSKVQIDSDLGIAMDVIDPEIHTEQKTIRKKSLADKSRREMRGEELRVLYVAMTRAKELLILTAAKSGISELIEKLVNRAETAGGVDYSMLSKGRSYLEWLLPTLSLHPDLQDFFDCSLADLPETEAEGHFDGVLLTPERIEEMEQTAKSAITESLIEQLDRRLTFAEEERERDISANFERTYDYEILGRVPSTMSVSTLKHMAMVEAENPAETIPGTEEREEIESDQKRTMPAFLKKEEKRLGGAARGDAFHHFLAEADFLRMNSTEDIEEQIEDQVKRGLLSTEEGEVISRYGILRMIRSETGARMIRAARDGQLQREKQFIIGLHPGEIRELKLGDEIPGDEESYVTIQGIIDCFWVEDGEIVILDYKTDSVRQEDGAEVLSKRYSAQLAYYQKALERATGMRVKERYLYSFAIGDIVPV